MLLSKGGEKMHKFGGKNWIQLRLEDAENLNYVRREREKIYDHREIVSHNEPGNDWFPGFEKEVKKTLNGEYKF